jgi:uncharacterized protein (DUF433 family)
MEGVLNGFRGRGGPHTAPPGTGCDSHASAGIFPIAVSLHPRYRFHVMPTLDATQAVPLTLGDDGTIRITGSRVTLDSVVHQFQQGATAEQIQEDFPSLTLRDIYGVIAYYLQHTPAVEDYLRTQAQAATQTRREIEAGPETGELRERLRQRRAASVK